MMSAISNYTVLYELGKYSDLELEIADCTITFPSSGTVYIKDDGTIKFISNKENAINEIKGQPFFK